ncbi:MAG: glycosyltransferase family 1 protein [Candidatus Aminicenantes bacterium]|nr:glycosyltransferase family 1 protein [Candidatus Aminicenantes bacterium]
MRVALYAGAFKANQDGATRSLYQLVRSLQADGMEVGVWSYDRTPTSGAGWVAHFTVPSLPLPLYPAYRISLPVRETLRQLDRFRPDLFHIAVADMAGRAFLRYALEHRLPAIATYHTDFASYLKYFRLAFLTGPSQRSLAAFFNRCRWVYVPTPSAACDLESWGVQNVRLWSRGVDHDQFHPGRRRRSLRRAWRARGKKVILFAGRFVSYKNLEAVEAVYARFDSRLPERARFVMLGDGPWLKRLQRTMPQAVFPGYLHGRELAETFASADLLLFPSATETFGNVVLEALASGVPAVVSNRGGCADIVRESAAGIACPTDDHEAFFQACRRLCEHPLLHARMRRLGLAYASGRRWPAINQRIINDFRMIAAYGHPTARRPASLPLGEMGCGPRPQQDSI